MKHVRRWVALGVACALVMAPLAPGREVPPTPLGRLLGPIGSLAATVQWVRVDAELDAGRPQRAYALAERALALAPADEGGWLHLARHLAYQRGSPEVEPLPARRTQWVNKALAVLARGEAGVDQPHLLRFERGLLLLHVGLSDGAVPWPGGTDAALEQAAAAMEEAARLHSNGKRAN
ncbi:MAG: tetratricopeptide repeat protein [Planctomycetota bacterium]|jgi:hypothetical protein|nr:tetratricopeptide repeat protein [Planctomycetota bacterium]MDP6763587.1 tetratricopeptide repeat protein [Planctomycetota bacterium]MDP6988464.1 tetratricopeptide repeat protein [Planctomycetota bacterium]